jgi:putative DNA primase/helicase
MAPGGQWLRHQDGLWLSDAEDLLHQRVIALLGSRYRDGVWKDTRAILQAIHTRKIIDEEIDREYINCPNGLLDLRTEALLPHTPEVLNFNQIVVEWNPAADCPEFDKWALEVFRDPDNVRLAWEILGYCLYNDMPIQKAIVLIHGEGAPSGRNGKGSYLRIIESVLGVHNITAVPPQAFGEDRWAAASLYGKLANLAGDVSPQPFKDAATFKSLTGQDIVRADIKYREPIMFRNRATILASFNELPSSADRSKGFLERWVALPFFGNFSDNRADPGVVDRIVERELQGILVKAVRALKLLLERGYFGASVVSKAAMKEFKLNVDSVRRFLHELSEEPELAGPAPRVPPWLCADLYAAYKGWCEDQGYRPLGRNKFILGVESATDSPFGPLVKTRRNAGMALIPAEGNSKVHDLTPSDSPF